MSPQNEEVGTQEAARILNVSRPYIIKLLQHHRKVGNRHRILVSDLLAYKAQDDLFRQRILDEMVAENQRLGGYQP